MDYVQRVVWIGTVLGGASIEEFEKYFEEELGFHVKYETEFRMVDGYYKGLNCIVFKVRNDDIPKFCMFRIRTTDMKWLEDFTENEGSNVPLEVYEKYEAYLCD